jgi:hypothetical protein
MLNSREQLPGRLIEAKRQTVAFVATCCISGCTRPEVVRFEGMRLCELHLDEVIKHANVLHRTVNELLSDEAFIVSIQHPQLTDHTASSW